MGKTSVCLAGQTPVYRALRKVLTELGLPCEEPGSGVTYYVLPVGLLVYRTKKEFFRSFHSIQHRCRFVLAAHPLEDSWRVPPPWREMRPDVKEAFKDRCHLVPLRLDAVIAGIQELQVRIECARDKGMHNNEDCCGRASAAYQVYHLVEQFSHGARDDITNGFLAPVRMLLKPRPERVQTLPACEALGEPKRACTDCGIRELLEKFDTEVYERLKREAPVYGELGAQLCTAWDRVHEWLTNSGDRRHDVQTLDVAALDRLMDLLTECRDDAGVSPDPMPVTSGERTEPIVPASGRPQFRVLVIDDHAKRWRPIIGGVARKLDEQQKPTAFEFSADSKQVLVCMDGGQPYEAKPIARFLPDFDAILLDVFLPYQWGIDLLTEIRKCSLGIPVIIWTTSRALELASSATLANGFVFKKTATIDEIADLFNRWLEDGRSRRVVSLPNPFFDHMIVAPSLRKCALDFTNWCLKHLDGFHALDNRYFKFFNDHGGRHIIVLLGILEKLLRPFLYDGTGSFGTSPGETNKALFSPTNATTRQREVLCLYIAVLCHELGMFPMRKPQRAQDGRAATERDRDGDRENFETFDAGELNLMREQHAFRSLLILSDEKHWSSDFKHLMAQLFEAVGEYAEVAVPLLAGYHGRSLDLKPGRFCVLDEDSEAWKNLKDAEERHKTLSVTPEELQARLGDLGARLGRLSSNGDAHVAERLARLCAVLRLADGIDIDHTRVPADFILYHSARSVRQDVENLKRQVVREVVIDRGTISVIFNEPAPQLTQLITEFNSCKRDEVPLLTPEDLRLSSAGHKMWTFRSSIKNVCANWLTEYMKRNVADRSKDEKVAKAFAALAVMVDMLDEYSPINDLGLDDYIKLSPDVRWESSVGDFALLSEQPQGVFELDIKAEDLKKLRLSEDEKHAVRESLEEMFREVDKRCQVPKTVELESVGGDRAGASTMVLRPGEAQPWFCKVDTFERVEQEYKGLRHYAALYLPGHNLLSDVRIHKYRDVGVFLGSYLGPSEHAAAATPITLEEYVVSQGDTLPNDEACNAVKQLFWKVLRCDAITSLEAESTAEVYCGLYRRLSRIFKSSEPHLDHEPREPVRSRWHVLRDRWNEFEERAKDAKLPQSFIHGNVHPRDVFIRPGAEGPERFVLTDTLYSGFGHALADLARFVVLLNMYTVEALLAQKRNLGNALDYVARLEEIAKDAIRGHVDESVEFELQYSIALVLAYFDGLTNWTHKLKSHKADIIVDAACERLEKLVLGLPEGHAAAEASAHEDDCTTHRTEILKFLDRCYRWEPPDGRTADFAGIVTALKACFSTCKELDVLIRARDKIADSDPGYDVVSALERIRDGSG